MVDCPSVNSVNSSIITNSYCNTNYHYNSVFKKNNFMNSSAFIFNDKLNVNRDGAKIAYMNASIIRNSTNNELGKNIIYSA